MIFGFKKKDKKKDPPGVLEEGKGKWFESAGLPWSAVIKREGGRRDGGVVG